MSTDLIIVCTAFGSVLSIILLILLRKKFFFCGKKKDNLPPRHAAFSLGGNLVKDADTPINNVYNVTTNILGHGSSAQVVIGEHKITKRKYAIKVIELTRKEVAWRYEREKNFLRDIDHTNVVRLYEVYREPMALYFVMELCTGGHLGQVLRSSRNGRLKENIAREYIQQLTRAIVHCHHHSICHRDVKLQNILLENKNKDAQIKLLDFGNGARFRGHLPMRKIVGTTYTAAPEVFKEYYDERCDVWSLGVVTYILLSGRRPFEKVPLTPEEESRLIPVAKQEGGSVVASILLGKYDFDHEVWDEISSEAINFIQYCLVLDYTKRNTAAEMLEHPWLTYSDDEYPTMGVDGLSRISQNSANTLQKTLKRGDKQSQFSGMRNASMLAVAFNIPTNKIQKLRALFQEMDQDGSGSIDRDEFYTAVHSVNPEMSKEDIYEIFDRMDQDWNRCISFIEFLAAMVDPDDIDMQDMNQAFQLLDKDNKGYITRDDLLTILSTGNAEDLEISQRTAAQSPSTMGPAGALARSFSGKFLGNNSINSGLSNRSDMGGSLNSRGLLISGAGGGNNNESNFSPSNINKDKEKSAKLKAAAKAALRNKKIQERIADIVEKADVNRDGVISYTEFLFAMAEGAVGSKRGNSTTLETLQHAPSVIPSRRSPRKNSRILAPLDGVQHSNADTGVTPTSDTASPGSGAMFNFRSALAPLVGPDTSSPAKSDLTSGLTPNSTNSKPPLPIVRRERRQTDGGASINDFIGDNTNSRRFSAPLVMQPPVTGAKKSSTAPGGDDSAGDISSGLNSKGINRNNDLSLEPVPEINVGCFGCISKSNTDVAVHPQSSLTTTKSSKKYSSLKSVNGIEAETIFRQEKDQQGSNDCDCISEHSSDLDSSRIPTFFQQTSHDCGSSMERFRSFRNKSLSFRSNGSSRVAGANATPRSHRDSHPNSDLNSNLSSGRKSTIVDGIVGIITSVSGSNRSSGRVANSGPNATVSAASADDGACNTDVEMGHGGGDEECVPARIDLAEVSRRIEQGYAVEDDMRMNDDDQGLLSMTHHGDDITISTAAHETSEVHSFDDASLAGDSVINSPDALNPETNSNRSTMVSESGGHAPNQDDSGTNIADRSLRVGNSSDSKVDDDDDSLSFHEYMNTEVFTLSGRQY